MKALQNIKLAFIYALLVFGVGFCLGAIRVLFVVPQIGVRWAETLEAPLMVLASFLAARFVLNGRGPFDRLQSIFIGLMALGFMACAEFSFVFAQGMTISGYLAAKDLVSGSVYLISLGMFALMPLVVTFARRPG
jgi:hypothetical protein